MTSSIRCLIVDDEPIAIEVLKGYVDQIPQLELAGTSANAMEAFQLLSQKQIDLVFLDIEMPEMSGIDFIKSLASPPQVILTTAYRKYALDSYDIDVVDYLLKPISFNRFFKAITKYYKLTSVKPIADPGLTPPNREGGFIFVYADKKNIKVYFEDILYVESIKDYIRIHTSGKTIISKDTIRRYEELLPDSFLRIHRSYIVNTSKINAFTQHDIEIGEKELPIGISYKHRVMEYLKTG